MIIWLVSKLVCLMYGVQMLPEARAFCVLMSWVELIIEAVVIISGLLNWWIERENK